MDTKAHGQIETMVEVIEDELATRPWKWEASGISEATQLKTIAKAIDRLNEHLIAYLTEYPQTPIRKTGLRMAALVALVQCELWDKVDGYTVERSNEEWGAVHGEENLAKWVSMGAP
jgi:hypothetical protein